jgi:N-acetylmuramic acid 6-phosphate etherase
MSIWGKIRSLVIHRLFPGLGLILLFFLPVGAEREDPGILRLLGIKPSARSVDYVSRQGEFQLHTLLTEQRHPLTMDLSAAVKSDTVAGLKLLLEVDRDISRRIEELAARPRPIEAAVSAVEEAIVRNRKIYIYGCGATGRLAKQMESSLWRPFWKEAKQKAAWGKIGAIIPGQIEEALIGEMTGGDRALISSLEGFEDLQMIGRRQLAERGVRKGDAVFCITEGGETSSVIGGVLAALDPYRNPGPPAMGEARKHLFFIYNNPDRLLLPFARSRAVIENGGITKINLATGPQAIAGSTRMQAATIETFVMGVVLEEGIARVLKRILTPSELDEFGMSSGQTLSQRLRSFIPLQQAAEQSAAAIARLTDLESAAYALGKRSTYFASRALVTVFIDSTERSPTFRLVPLDPTTEPVRKCWIQVWTPAASGAEAWTLFLKRPFRGLDPALYAAPFSRIQDPFLREAAIRSLARAGNDQQPLYDFSFAPFNMTHRSPEDRDVGVTILLDDEIVEAAAPGSPFRRWFDFCRERGVRPAMLAVSAARPGRKPPPAWETTKCPSAMILLEAPCPDDFLNLRRQVALKMILNAHSTAVMAKLGRVVGNTMVFVSPSNLKLIGRATELIQNHVNDVLGKATWRARFGRTSLISYREANAVLFDAVDFLSAGGHAGETAEVALSIIRILEARRRNSRVAWEDALALFRRLGLEEYLSTATLPVSDKRGR